MFDFFLKIWTNQNAAFVFCFRHFGLDEPKNCSRPKTNRPRKNGYWKFYFKGNDSYELLWVIIMTSSSYPISNMPHKKKRSSFSLRKEVWSFGVGIKNKYLGEIPWVGSDLFSDWSIFSSFFSHLKSVLLSLEVKSFSIESVEVKSPRPRLRENDLAPSCGMLFQFSTLMTHDCIPNDS